MKLLAPLILGVIAGWFAFAELHITNEDARWVFDYLSSIALILAATAYILGGLNVLQVNYPKIRRREADWQYKVILLAGAVVMGLAGIAWHSFGGDRESGSSQVIASADQTTRISVRSEDREAMVSIDGEIMRAWHSGQPDDIYQPPGDQPLSVAVEPGEHVVSVFMPYAGYSKFTATETLQSGQTTEIQADLIMYWGAETDETGRVYTWLYDYVFFPCNATMFALLAFFIASAAFRAFRARNVEAALLLGAAILVMLGLVPIGRLMWDWFPDAQEWIVRYLNTAGRRAIMMGAALGAIATGLRIILGLERSHLGGD